MGPTGINNWENAKAIIRDNSAQGIELGTYWQHALRVDVKHALFTLSRYKFAAKLLMYRKGLTICELGCNEALGALMFQQNTDLKRYLGVDSDGEAIEYNRRNFPANFQFLEADFFDMELNEQFDAVVSLDVIEHIPQEREEGFCRIITEHLREEGVAVVGTPNVAMSPYAGEVSRAGHINLYDQARLYELMQRFFHNVFIFGMNDEVVHTGFAPMACYIFAVCTGKKN